MALTLTAMNMVSDPSRADLAYPHNARLPSQMGLQRQHVIIFLTPNPQQDANYPLDAFIQPKQQGMSLKCG